MIAHAENLFRNQKPENRLKALQLATVQDYLVLYSLDRLPPGSPSLFLHLFLYGHFSICWQVNEEGPLAGAFSDISSQGKMLPVLGSGANPLGHQEALDSLDAEISGVR